MVQQPLFSVGASSRFTKSILSGNKWLSSLYHSKQELTRKEALKMQMVQYRGYIANLFYVHCC
ncbi:hypothetical protein V6Z12_A10G257000 [Gossypium hirsutum]